jgi:hypothetical protein
MVAPRNLQNKTGVNQTKGGDLLHFHMNNATQPDSTHKSQSLASFRTHSWDGANESKVMEVMETPKHLRLRTDKPEELKSNSNEIAHRHKSEEPKLPASKPTLHIGRVSQDAARGRGEGAVLESALKIKEDQRGASGPVSVPT